KQFWAQATADITQLSSIEETDCCSVMNSAHTTQTHPHTLPHTPTRMCTHTSLSLALSLSLSLSLSLTHTQHKLSLSLTHTYPHSLSLSLSFSLSPQGPQTDQPPMTWLSQTCVKICFSTVMS